jgi:hypothetical protein
MTSRSTSTLRLARAKRSRSSSDRRSRISAGSPSERPTTAALLAEARVVDEDLHEEAVDLRLGELVGALGLDRVLRGEHEERLRDAERLAADRHLVLLHDLEQRGLDLGRRAVDLVGEQEVAEDRAELDVEAPGVRTVDARADEVGGHEVGRELDAAEVPPSTRASVFTVSVLARPGTPSSSTWPPVSRATSRRSSIASWPTMTRLISYSASSRAWRGSSRRPRWVVVLVHVVGLSFIRSAGPNQRMDMRAPTAEREAAGGERARHLALLVLVAELGASRW